MLSLDPVAVWVPTLSLGGLWARAGLHKLRDLARFGSTLDAYAILPQAMVSPLSRLMPMSELSLAVGLVLPFSRRAAATAGASVLLIYMTAIGINLRRGRRELDCGCSGFGHEQPISPQLLIRNGILALLSLGIAILPPAGSSWRWIDACTVAAAVLAIALIDLTAEQLTRTGRRLARARA